MLSTRIAHCVQEVFNWRSQRCALGGLVFVEVVLRWQCVAYDQAREAYGAACEGLRVIGKRRRRKRTTRDREWLR